MESFHELLKCLGTDVRSSLDNWLYNAHDHELKEALKILTSESSFQICSPKILKSYETFIKLLLKGHLLQPPQVLLDDDPEKVNIQTISCNILVDSLTKIIKSSVYQKIFKLFSVLSVIYNSQEANSNTLKNKEFIYYRKLSRIETILKIHENSQKKSAFFTLPFKTRYFHLKKRKNLEKTKKLSKYCVWIMLMKGRIINEQQGFWKWKADLHRSEIFSYFHKFWTHQSRMLNLLRMIIINCNTRSLDILRIHFKSWQDLMAEYKVLDRQQLQLENTFNNLECLMEVKLFLRLNSIFQELKEKSKKMRTKKEKAAFVKSRLQNLGYLARKLLKSVMIVWKNKIKLQKFWTLTEVNTRLTLTQKQTIRYCIARIKSRLKHSWNIWVSEKLSQKEVSCSVESTMDLSNFILPYEKSQKIRVLIPHLFNIITYKKHSRFVYFTKWMQKAYKNVLSIVNLKIIMRQQIIKNKAKKAAFSELVLACAHPSNFTDVD